MTDRCPHCPDGHDNPTVKPWAAWVASDRDGDGQPTHLIVQPTDCSHVAESDAEWMRRRINWAFGVPDRLAGLPAPWWRHLWQRWTRRPGGGSN